MVPLPLLAAAASAAAFLAVYLMTPPLTRLLNSRGMAVPDIAKPGGVMVARPGGISIIAGIVSGGAVFYALLPIPEVPAVLGTAVGAFLVGYVDDRRVMGGWFKPVMLGIAAAPILLFGAYDTDLAFPIFGDVHIPVLYLAVIVITVSLTGNTINSIDVVNGAASGFMVIATFALAACLFVMQSYEVAALSLVLGFASLAFYRYHRLPSSIFPGDSGALAFGSTYGALAIVGGAEVAAAVALLPAVVNSFLFLSSVKAVKEHRQVKGRPVELTKDYKMRATRDPRAAVTLVRLLLAGGPMTEGQVCRAILKLAAFAGALAVATAFMTVGVP